VLIAERYLYFATESRKSDPEYRESQPLTEEEHDDDTEKESEAGEEPSVDPETKSWIMPSRDEQGPDSVHHGRVRKVIELESDTESESEEFDPEEPYDFGVVSVSDGANSPRADPEDDIRSRDPVPESPTNVNMDIQMGYDSHANEYDTELIFKHLMFYLDSPTNARSNGMEVTASALIQDLSEKEMATIEQLITENGGKVTSNLEESKLTHVVLFKQDISRRVVLMRRTSTPKRRHLVLSTFVSGCIQEETLLDEDAFAP